MGGGTLYMRKYNTKRNPRLNTHWDVLCGHLHPGVTYNFFPQEQERQEKVLKDSHSDVSYGPCHHPLSPLLLITVLRFRRLFFNLNFYLLDVTSERKPFFTQTIISIAKEDEGRETRTLIWISKGCGECFSSWKSEWEAGAGGGARRGSGPVAKDPKSKKKDGRS